MKHQPTVLVIGYALIGLTGLGLPFLLDANPVVETGVLFLAGLLVGFSVESLVKNRLRKSSSQLFSPKTELTDKDH